jgi:hypothetical protein
MIKNYVPVPAAALAQRDAAPSPTPENASEGKDENGSSLNSLPASDDDNSVMQGKLGLCSTTNSCSCKTKKDENTINTDLAKCADGGSAILKMLVHMIAMNKSIRLKFFSNLTVQDAKEIVLLGAQKYTEKSLSAVLKTQCRSERRASSSRLSTPSSRSSRK